MLNKFFQTTRYHFQNISWYKRHCLRRLHTWNLLLYSYMFIEQNFVRKQMGALGNTRIVFFFFKFMFLLQEQCFYLHKCYQDSWNHIKKKKYCEICFKWSLPWTQYSFGYRGEIKFSKIYFWIFNRWSCKIIFTLRVLTPRRLLTKVTSQLNTYQIFDVIFPLGSQNWTCRH